MHNVKTLDEDTIAAHYNISETLYWSQWSVTVYIKIWNCKFETGKLS